MTIDENIYTHRLTGTTHTNHTIRVLVLRNTLVNWYCSYTDIVMLLATNNVYMYVNQNATKSCYSITLTVHMVIQFEF